MGLNPEEMKYWEKCEDVAMHFNDLLVKMRTGSLTILSGMGALGGAVLGISGRIGDTSAQSLWGCMAMIFGVISLIWLAIWILDHGYYSKLLQGAVDELLAIEEDKPTPKLSTRIEKRTNSEGVWAFYALVELCFSLGFIISLEKNSPMNSEMEDWGFFFLRIFMMIAFISAIIALRQIMRILRRVFGQEVWSAKLLNIIEKLPFVIIMKITGHNWWKKHFKSRTGKRAQLLCRDFITQFMLYSFVVIVIIFLGVAFRFGNLSLSAVPLHP